MSNYKINQRVVYVGSSTHEKSICCNAPKLNEIVTIEEISPLGHIGYLVISEYRTDLDGDKQALHSSGFRPLQYTSATTDLAISFTETEERSDVKPVEKKETREKRNS